jgi:catechol 2,3-dioxygenase-like lactoylglutathione lyase family enzyme
VQRILETSLYHDSAQRDQMKRFYGELLALPLVASWPDGMAFRLGDGVLLIFDRELIEDREEPMAQHGTSGPGHICLVEADGYENWKRRLAEAGVEITHEHDWDGGRRSFYFQDPAGNLLEIADCDLWPRPRPR